MEIPRPTGIDVDGESHIYAASWRGAVFTYAGPNVGFIVRASPKGVTPTSFPDVKKATDESLVEMLKSPSLVWRLHAQHEILRRGDKAAFDEPIEKLATAAEQSIPVRVAAMYTIKQLQAEKSNSFLQGLARDASICEFALRALTDEKSETATVPTDLFTGALTDPNARVRLQAVIGIGRLDRPQIAASLIPLLVDGDPNVAHAAVQGLIALHATEACFAALDTGSPSVVPGRRGCCNRFTNQP